MVKLLINFMVFCQKFADICNTETAVYIIANVYGYGWVYDAYKIISAK